MFCNEFSTNSLVPNNIQTGQKTEETMQVIFLNKSLFLIFPFMPLNVKCIKTFTHRPKINYAISGIIIITHYIKACLHSQVKLNLFQRLERMFIN